MKPLNVVNVVLVALIVLAVWSFVERWQAFEESAAAGVDEAAGSAAEVPAFVASEDPGGVDTSAIVRANPFSVDRSSTVAVPDEAPAPTGPSPYLFGTIRIGDDQMAMMAPSSAINRNEYRPFRVGQFVDGWEIVEIDEKSVVVASGGGRRTITMNDPSARLPRVPRDRPRPSTNTGGQVSTVGAASKAPDPAPSPAAPAASSDPGTPRTVPYETPFGTIQKAVP